MAKASWRGSFVFEQVFLNQNLHQLIPVDFADHAAGAAVVGDVGGILGEQIAHDLVDGIVTFFVQGIEHTPEYVPHVFFVAGDRKGLGFHSRHGLSLLVDKMIELLYAGKERV